MDKTDEITVGDVVSIKRGTRYPPTQDDSIGIVIDELPTTGDWPVFIVMWDGQMAVSYTHLTLPTIAEV